MRIEASSDGRPCQYQNMVNPTTGSQGVNSQSCRLDIKMKGNPILCSYLHFSDPQEEMVDEVGGCSLIRC